MQLCKDLGLPVHGTNKNRLDRIYDHLYGSKYHTLVSNEYYVGEEE